MLLAVVSPARLLLLAVVAGAADLGDSATHDEELLCSLRMESPAALRCSWRLTPGRERTNHTAHNPTRHATHRLRVYSDGSLVGSCDCAAGQCEAAAAAPGEEDTQALGPNGDLSDQGSPGFGEEEKRDSMGHGVPMLSCEVPVVALASRAGLLNPLGSVCVWLQQLRRQTGPAAGLLTANLTANLTGSCYSNITTRVFQLRSIVRPRAPVNLAAKWRSPVLGLLLRWSNGYDSDSPLWTQLHYQVQQGQQEAGGATAWQLPEVPLRSPELRLGPRPPIGAPSLALRVRSAAAPRSFYSGTWSPWSRVLVVPGDGPPTTTIHPDPPAHVRTEEHVKRGVRDPGDPVLPTALGVTLCVSALGAALIVSVWSRLRASVWPPVPDPGEVVQRLLKEVETGRSVATLTGKVAAPEAQPPVVMVVVTSPDPEMTRPDPDQAQTDPDPTTPTEATPGPPRAQSLLPAAPPNRGAWTPGPFLKPGVDYISLE